MKPVDAAEQILDLATTPAHKRLTNPVSGAVAELAPRWRGKGEIAALVAGAKEALRLVERHGSVPSALDSLRPRKVG